MDTLPRIFQVVSICILASSIFTNRVLMKSTEVSGGDNSLTYENTRLNNDRDYKAIFQDEEVSPREQLRVEDMTAHTANRHVAMLTERENQNQVNNCEQGRHVTAMVASMRRNEDRDKKSHMSAVGIQTRQPSSSVKTNSVTAGGASKRWQSVHDRSSLFTAGGATPRRHSGRHCRHLHTTSSDQRHGHTAEGGGPAVTSERNAGGPASKSSRAGWAQLEDERWGTTEERPSADTTHANLTVTEYTQNASSPHSYLGRHDSLSISIDPGAIPVMFEDSYVVILVNCSFDKENGTRRTIAAIRLIVRVTSKQTRVVIPYKLTIQNRSSIPNKLDYSGMLEFSMDCLHNPSLFGLYINNVGRSSVEVRFAQAGMQGRELYRAELEIAAVRGVRHADVAFDCAVPLVLLLVTLSAGALTDVTQLRAHVPRPAPVIIALLCQFVVLPPVSAGVAALWLQEPDMGLGLLLVTVVPGGGGGHLMIAIAGGEVSLSLLLNFTALTFTLALAPLWLLCLGSLLKDDRTFISYHTLALWISCTVIVYFLGICLRKRSRAIAEGLLNWLTKPFLLLTSILYITLGIFTNTYLFLVLDLNSFIAIVIYSSLCYCITFIVPFLLQQPLRLCKTIASHCAVPNCLLSLVLSRYTINQPAADIASVVPILLLVFSYLPFLVELIFKITRKLLRERFEKTEDDKERLRSSSRLNIQKVNSNSTGPMESCSHTSVLTQVTQTEGYKSTVLHEQVTAV